MPFDKLSALRQAQGAAADALRQAQGAIAGELHIEPEFDHLADQPGQFLMSRGVHLRRGGSGGVEVELEDGLAVVDFAGEPEAVLLVEGDG